MFALHLRNRLLLSYVVVAALLVAAFVQMAVGLKSTNALVARLMRDELPAFEREQRVYRAAWSVELAIRRGIVSCAQFEGAALEAVRSLRTARAELEDALQDGGKGIQGPVRESAQAYLELARTLEVDGSCRALLALPLREARLALDERLTTVWSERTGELRMSIQAKDQAARDEGATALRTGLLFGVLGIFVAGLLAVGQSRALASSVAALSMHARRIGQGDFQALPPLRGPAELRELALDLDRMRSRLAELDQLKTAFVASVSHDLRTPLARVREALGLLADQSVGPLNEKQARVVQLAQGACEREIRLVTSVLDLSRAQSGQPLRRNDAAAIDAIVSVVIDDLAFEARERKVELKYERRCKPVVGPMDDPLVERALSNLVSNAISVSKPGQTVTIVCDTIERAAPWSDVPVTAVELTVVDEGPGVAPHAREMIFRPFASRHVLEGRQGTGLGLALAREMVVAHGGQLVLVDHEGPGAIFSFWIPLHQTPKAS